MNFHSCTLFRAAQRAGVREAIASVKLTLRARAWVELTL